MAKDLDKSLVDLQGKMNEIGDQLHKMDKDSALQQAAFMEHLNQHERMYEEFKRTNDILKTNTESLKEHMHRTELLEDLVQKMDGRLLPIEKLKIETEAIKKHKHEQLVRWGKIIAAVVGIIGLLAGAKPLLIKLLIP